MYSLVERHGIIYLREYSTYDRPDFTIVCSLSDLGIQSLKELPIQVVGFDRKQDKSLASIEVMTHYNNMSFYADKLFQILKISLENNEILKLVLFYGYIRIYASKEIITYIKVKGID